MPIIARHIRVSSKDQKVKGALDKMRFFVDQATLELGGELIDKYLWVDTESAYKRSEELYNLLIKRLELHKPDVLVCYRIDRSMRNVKYAMQLQEFLTAKAIKLYVVQDARFFDFANPADWQSYANQAVAAEAESRTTSARIKKAYEWKRKEGLANQKAPWGWATVRRRYVCTEPEAVRWAFDEFFIHRNTIKLRQQFLDRFNKYWNPNGIIYWLSHPIHAGHTAYGRYSATWAQIVPNTHDGIISDQERQEVIRIIKENRKYWGAINTAARHPLSGLIFCSECGSSMYRSVSTTRKGEPKPPRYFCRNTLTCKQRKAPLERDLEALIVEALIGAAAQIADIAATPTQSKSAELIEQENLLQSLNRLGADPAIELARAQIRGKIAALESVSRCAPTIDLNLLEQFKTPRLWQELKPHEKRSIFHHLVQSVTVHQTEGHWAGSVQLRFELTRFDNSQCRDSHHEGS